MGTARRRAFGAAAAVAFAMVVLVGCGDDPPADGFQSVATGDTYGEWELFAEYEDGEWTGCLRLDDGEAHCGDPDDQLATYEEVDLLIGAVAEGEQVVDDDGEAYDLFDGRFFVATPEAGVQLEG